MICHYKLDNDMSLQNKLVITIKTN